MDTDARKWNVNAFAIFIESALRINSWRKTYPCKHITAIFMMFTQLLIICFKLTSIIEDHRGLYQYGVMHDGAIINKYNRFL